MKKFLALLLVLLAPAVFGQPRRIVSTTPSITEMLYALGLGDRVVGVTNYCHYPPEAMKKPKIGTYTDPDLETILSLRPDLVIVQTNPVNLTARLQAMKLDVLEVNQDTIAAIYTSIRTIADATGARPRADQLIASLEGELAAIRRKTRSLRRVPVMFVVGRAPGALSDIVVVGQSSYLNELFDIAGGDNIFRGAVAAYPQVSMEEILSRNPEVIIDMGDMAQTIGVTDEHKQSIVKLWSRYPTLGAVKQKRVFVVASDIFVVPGPRMIDAARAFVKMLHPEAGF